MFVCHTHVHNVDNVLNVHPTNHAQVFRASSLASWQPGLATSCQLSRIFPFTQLVPAGLRAKSAIYGCLVFIIMNIFDRASRTRTARINDSLEFYYFSLFFLSHVTSAEVQLGPNKNCREYSYETVHSVNNNNNNNNNENNNNKKTKKNNSNY